MTIDYFTKIKICTYIILVNGPTFCDYKNKINNITVKFRQIFSFNYLQLSAHINCFNANCLTKIKLYID